MGESFEARLMRFSSKEIFKQAKKLLHGEELVCCHESAGGILRAVFRDGKGIVTRTELTGFPDGPFHTSCSCPESVSNSLCPHSMAACLHHAKYTIKSREKEVLKDAPAQFAGLKFSGMSELLKEALNTPSSRIELHLEKDFPHVPSKWERITFSASMTANGRKYLGNLNNLRNLHFDKVLSVSLKLADFPLQDQQIIRFLALNAQQDGGGLSLDAEQTAEFFHCLPDFDRFFKDRDKIKVHPEIAEPALILENVKGGTLLKSAVLVNDSLLPLADVKVINGRSGCWLGMLGEYWWMPARVDVGWLRNFLRTTIQPCSSKAVDALVNAQESLPFKLIESNGVRLKAKKFQPVYKGIFRKDGSLLLELQFDYDGHLCKYDHGRLASYRGRFWKRNTLEEEKIADELVNFGFRRAVSGKTPGETRFLLRDPEAIGAFTGEVIPKWFASGQDFMISSNLARMGSDHVLLKLHCSLAAQTEQYFDLRVKLFTAVSPVSWKQASEAASAHESFSVLDGEKENCMRIPEKLSRLVAWASEVAENLPLPEGEDPLIHGELLRLPRAAALRWAELSSGIADAVPVEFLRLKAAADSASDENVPQEENPLFCGELRKYQQAGVFWMRKLSFSSFNVILADEMGLGKTVQTLALLASSFRTPGPAGEKALPSLIVCPTTLVENWVREAARFVPSMRVLAVTGPDHKEKWKSLPFADLCISSYAIIKRDAQIVGGTQFNYIVLDEAQHIKNPATGNAKVCKSLSALHKLVLTGTPLENSPEDLWSIMDFLHPGLLGNLASFRRRFCGGTEPGAVRELSERISPFILRRKKEDVFTEIPPKSEQILYCEMEEEQKKFYETFLEETRRKCRAAASDPAVSRMEILSSLLRMRQVCCDPSLIPEEKRGGANNVGSAKMELLKELLLQTLDSGHRVLLFSQFTSLLAVVRKFLEENEIPYEYLDGSTKDRFAHVDRFNNSHEIPVFLLSLKAGGLGLNLTSADTVILYDPWWNPTAEAQAMDRSHRIGQTRKVNCVKLIVKDSVEEKVLELQKNKQDLFRDVVENSTEGMRSLSLEDFEFLLS